MANTIFFEHSVSEFGYVARKRTIGPEYRLINGFAESILAENTKNVAVFWEPFMDTGYPDLILAYYSSRAFDFWAQNRRLLTVTDIKVLHYLYLVNGATSEIVESQLGLSAKKLLPSIERLLDSKMIRRYSKKWTPYSIKKRYAIQKLVAYEAKISDWTTAFKQGEMNKWFASESFVVSPITKPAQTIINKSNENGVGIYSCNEKRVKCISRAQSLSLPSCYASWMFNEWIGRKLYS